MTSMIKFVDSNIFIERWSNEKAKEFTNSLDREKHCTSVLALAEVCHKLKKKNVENVFDFIRGIMGSIKVFNFTQQDLFDAIKNPSDININDKINIAVMKNNGITTIISYDKDYNRDKSIIREEL